MELENMTMTDGYVGQFGKTWKTPTEADLEEVIIGAMALNGMSRERVVAVLESGKALKWRKSSNFCYDHSYGLIGRKRNAPAVTLIKCSCGHSVLQSLVMRASLGTACPDCYDRMSD